MRARLQGHISMPSLYMGPGHSQVGVTPPMPRVGFPAGIAKSQLVPLTRCERLQLIPGATHPLGCTALVIWDASPSSAQNFQPAGMSTRASSYNQTPGMNQGLWGASALQAAPPSFPSPCQWPRSARIDLLLCRLQPLRVHSQLEPVPAPRTWRAGERGNPAWAIWFASIPGEESVGEHAGTHVAQAAAAAPAPSPSGDQVRHSSLVPRPGSFNHLPATKAAVPALMRGNLGAVRLPGSLGAGTHCLGGHPQPLIRGGGSEQDPAVPCCCHRLSDVTFHPPRPSLALI